MPLNDFRCLCCGSVQADAFLSGCVDYYMGKPGRFDYFRCTACGLVQLHPIPADLSVFYGGYQMHQRRSWIHGVVRRLVMIGGYYRPSPKSGALSILDFGCGDGWYLREMARHGHRCVGFEPNPEYARRLSADLGSAVFSKECELEEELRASVDVVTMHFVVEHVRDLRGTFALAHRLLKEKGIYYFVIPNIDSVEFKMFGGKWHGFDPPRHLSFPTASTIERIAGETGFKLEQIRTLALPNDIAGSLSNVLVGRYNYLAFCALLPVAFVACKLFGQGCLAVRLIKA